MWEVADARLVASGRHAKSLYRLTFAPAGDLLAATDYHGIVLIDAAHGRVLSRFDPGAEVGSLAWGPHGITAACHFNVVQLEISRGTRTPAM